MYGQNKTMSIVAWSVVEMIGAILYLLGRRVPINQIEKSGPGSECYFVKNATTDQARFPFSYVNIELLKQYQVHICSVSCPFTCMTGGLTWSVLM